MRPREGRGCPPKKKPASGATDAGGAKALGGLSQRERSTRGRGFGSVSLDTSPQAKDRVLRHALEAFSGSDRDIVEAALLRLEAPGRMTA